MSYVIVKNLKNSGKVDLLKQLEEGVQENERKKGEKHQVFRLSFDARECLDKKMVEQKLDYIHHNPVSGRWSLVEDSLPWFVSSRMGTFKKNAGS